MKQVALRLILLTPILSIVAVLAYFLLFTNVPPLLYLYSIRNIYFDCMEFSSADYVYKMKPGECNFKNLEFNVILTHDSDGFRNRQSLSDFSVATIGDSHTQGWGVRDDQTFSYLLESQYGFATRNLAIGSYATMRELEVLDQYGQNAKYVIVQYCDNDFSENLAAVRLSKEEFRSQVEAEWKGRIVTYNEGKSLGYRKPIHDLAVMIKTHSYTSKSNWRRGAERRLMEQEAAAFAQIVARYGALLARKRVIVFESADSGLNSNRFAQTFGSELRKLSWLTVRILDSTKILGFDDYYYLDGHPNAAGHRKLAVALAREISNWEGADPVLNRR